MTGRRRDRFSPFTAGLVAIVLVVVFTYLGFSKGNVPFTRHPFMVKAVFQNAASTLVKGSPVRIAGVNVGKVVKVKRGPGTTALVTMTLMKEGQPIHTDATAKIRPRLFLEGNFFVDLTPGTGAAPTLRKNGTIPLTQTKIPVQIDDVLDTLQSDTRQDLRNTVRGLAGAFAKGGAQAAVRGGKDGPAALANTAVVMNSALGDRPGELARFVSRTGQISAAVAQRETALQSLLGAFATTTSTLAQRSGDVDASLSALASTLGTARPELQAIADALPALKRFAGRLGPSLGVASSAISALRPFLRQTGRLASAPELPALSKKLLPTVATLNATIPPLQTFMDKTQPVSSCLARNVVPTITKSLDDGKLSTGQPAWQELAHMFVGLSTASSDFDGNGHSIRYNFGLSENSVASALPTTLTSVLGNAGTLGSVSQNPIDGARPQYTPNQTPPFEPDARCDQQDLPDLSAPAANAPASTRSVRLHAPAARQAVREDLKQRASMSVAQLRDKLTQLSATPPKGHK